jgi:hypothetical protein
MTRPILTTLVLALGAVAIAAPLQAQTRGYTARPSGFDLNFNTAAGQPGTADVNVCDGIGNETSTTGEDVDANGVNDRQVYVDLTRGNDTLACGLPNSPCRTIGFAMNAGNVSVPGGPIQNPLDAQIQAICFKGVGRETVIPTVSGAPGTYTLPQTGHQARSFNLPRYPFILSGWDANNNDQYPPYDVNDVAILDGTLGGAPSLDFAIANINHVSNIEYAHFTARNFGQNNSTSEGFMQVTDGGGTADQIYVHDLQLTDIMKGQAASSNRIVFFLFVGGTTLSNFAVVNVNSTNNGGGYLIRGAGSGTSVMGPYRFQNITSTFYGASGDGIAAMKLWDYVTGIEVLDNEFDLQPTLWSPCYTYGCLAPAGIGMSQCSHDWTVRGNVLNDFKYYVIVEPYAGGSGFCESRNLDNVVIDRNVFRNTYDAYVFGDLGIQLEVGKDPTATIGSVAITNNFLSSSTGWETCISLENGNPVGADPGIVTVANNTCDGPINRHSCIGIGNAEAAQPAFPGQRYVIKSNICSNIGPAHAVEARYRPSSLAIDSQTYDPSADFVWNGGAGINFATWKLSSGGDTSSKQCTPSYVNEPSGNFRLTTGDVCARRAGTAVTGVTVDIDGTPRPSPPSTGASEGGAVTPNAPVNLRIVN